MAFDFSAVAAPFRMQPGLRRIAPGTPQLTPNRLGDRALVEKLAVLSAHRDAGVRRRAWLRSAPLPWRRWPRKPPPSIRTSLPRDGADRYRRACARLVPQRRSLRRRRPGRDRRLPRCTAGAVAPGGAAQPRVRRRLRGDRRCARDHPVARRLPAVELGARGQGRPALHRGPCAGRRQRGAARRRGPPGAPGDRQRSLGALRLDADRRPAPRPPSAADRRGRLEPGARRRCAGGVGLPADRAADLHPGRRNAPRGVHDPCRGRAAAHARSGRLPMRASCTRRCRR